MIEFEYNEGVPDTNRYVLILDQAHYFGPVWHPARWENNHWEAYGFEEDDLELAPLGWIEMDFDVLKANKFENGPPDNERYVLILSDDHLGRRIWRPAAWLGEDDGPAGEYCWTLNGLGYTQHELGITHWMEMPPTEEREDPDTRTGYDIWP